jgi:hypothetical protein
MLVNARFPFYEGLQNSRQFHACRAADYQHITKSYKKPVAFFDSLKFRCKDTLKYCWCVNQYRSPRPHKTINVSATFGGLFFCSYSTKNVL